MAVDFFKKELGRIQTDFNRTFGTMPLCNPRVRIRTIFAIVQMGVLQKQIRKENRKEDISKFVKTRDKLNEIFATLIRERRQYGNRAKKHKPGIKKYGCFDNNLKRANWAGKNL